MVQGSDAVPQAGKNFDIPVVDGLEMPDGAKQPHLIASSGFLDDVPQHRTYWTIDTDLCYGPNTGTPSGIERTAASAAGFLATIE